MLLHGPTGVGKTCISQYVLKELASYTSNLKKSFVNCWTNQSNFKVLYEIISDMGSRLDVHRKGMGSEELLEKLRGIASDNNCIVTMDEIDQLEDDKLLYEFSQIPNLSLIFIANKETVFYDSDPRVRSRLQGMEEIEFPQYSKEELEDILSDRADWGLLPDVIKKAYLKHIAVSAKGDARKAITALRIAAENAENQDAKKISKEHVKQALPKVKVETKKKSISSLNEHQKVLYKIIQEKEEVKPSELYQKYEEKRESKNKDKVVRRTLRKYLKKMKDYDLIQSEGEGRWRSYKAID